MPSQFVPETLRTTHTDYVKKVSDTIETMNPLTRKLKEMGRLEYNQSGTSKTFEVRTEAFSLVGFASMTEFTRTVKDLHRPASIDWGGFCGGFAIPEIEAAVHDGKNSMTGKTMLKAAEEAFEADAAVYVENQFFLDNSAADPPRWAGLAASIRNPTGGTYAGLSMTTYPGWACKYFDGSVAYQSKTFVQAPAMFLLHAKNSTQNTSLSPGRGPDIVITTEDIFNALINHVNQGFQQITTYEKKVEYGGTGIRLAGLDIFWSPQCPSGKLYGLDSSTWKVSCVTGKLFDERSVVLQNMVGLGFDYWHFGQPWCDNLRKNFLIDNISFT